jgi:RimJ/RimL family protein N-acetyltransferase
MIVGEHILIRTADPDDADGLAAIGDAASPRSFFLDARREINAPTVDEMAETLRSKQARTGMFYAIEDKSGTIRGFSSLKMALHGSFFAEMLLAFLDEQDFAAPVGRETLESLLRMAFVDRKLTKIVAQILDCEDDYRGLLEDRGFTCDGRQREVSFARGRYHDLLAYSLFAETYAESAGAEAASTAADAGAPS